MQLGQTLGHEFMGIVVEEAGPEVHEVKKGGN
jgi:threonine dehydrogenase-like Zn-dependent dehydrogenase